MSDKPKGYRENVGAILRRADGKLMLAQRPGDGWQLPQGGVEAGESPEETLWRELGEELGFAEPQRVARIVGVGPPIRYDFPEGSTWRIARTYRGQEQTLFMLDFWGGPEDFRLDHHHTPEFVDVAWFELEEAVARMWALKRHILTGTLEALADVVARGYVGPC